MWDPIIYDCKSFPAEEFGSGLVREVQLIVSPETTGDHRIRLVRTTVPAGAVSESHIHPDADEYIIFDIPGVAVLDGVEYHVPEGGMVHAIKGVNHECRNTDPERTLTLWCVFVPAFEPYGKYPELIQKTIAYLEESQKSSLVLLHSDR